MKSCTILKDEIEYQSQPFSIENLENPSSVFGISLAAFWERCYSYGYIVFAENKKGYEHRQPTCETKKAHSKRTMRVAGAATK